MSAAPARVHGRRRAQDTERRGRATALGWGARRRGERRSRGVLAAIVFCWLCAVISPAGAGAATGASMRPSLLPDRLGVSSALTLAFRFSGGSEGVPAPLQSMAVRLPAGLAVELRRAGICAKGRLQSHGLAGCPASSLIGRGHGVMQVHAGSQLLGEEVSIAAFRGPTRGAHQTVELLVQGETPLDESTVNSGVLGGDRAPYGSQLTLSFPPVPTLVLEPDASFSALSLTLGGVGRSPRAHTAAAAIRVPRSCPAGGFPFAASFAFADGSKPSVSATVPCP